MVTTKPNPNLRVILIGGSSNAGKSTVAESLAKSLGWRHISTDTLARHPGRPWKPKPQAVPAHVVEHYTTLAVDELLVDVLRHYRGLWPRIEAMVTEHATDRSAERLILEGSALWPESVATLDVDHVAAIWLTASDELFRRRIHTASKFDDASPQERIPIQKFLARTLLYNERMMEAVGRLGLTSLDVEAASSPEELCTMCLESLERQF